jgi:heterodisulfide reductase subunit B
MAKTFSYYPGCSMHSTGSDFSASLKAICKYLGIELKEIPDWNCCGASATHIADHELGYNLALRNLILAEQMGGNDVVTPCASCFANLKHAEHEGRKKGSGIAGQFKGDVTVRNLLEVIVNEIGLDEIKKHTKQSLHHLKPAAYYGCLMVRPPEIMQMDDAEDPVMIDNVCGALGAQSVKWSYKTDCCGASLSVPRTDVVVGLISKIFTAAQESGANCIVTACPMCQLNLDTRQAAAAAKTGQNFNMPVYYFTELMGVAFGLQEYGNWFKKHIVNPLPLIEDALSAPPPPEPEKKKKKQEAAAEA